MPKTKDPMQQRSRKFCLTTYHSLEVVEGVLKNRPVRAAVYITHDKDTYTEADEKNNPENVAGTLKDKHIHIMLCTYNAATLGQVRRWFPSGQNTLGQVLNDDEQMLRYLTHADNPEKAQYADDEVITYGEGREPFLRAALSSGRSAETAESLINDILNGASTRTLIVRYGSEYIHYRKAYHDAAHAVYFEERDPQRKALEEWRKLCDLHEVGVIGEYDFARYEQMYGGIVPDYLLKKTTAEEAEKWK